tara:strand:+ start:570 stop:746 length:177 start_codon:yes stop_codon:yes gene_type:complete
MKIKNRDSKLKSRAKAKNFNKKAMFYGLVTQSIAREHNKRERQQRIKDSRSIKVGFNG